MRIYNERVTSLASACLASEVLIANSFASSFNGQN